MGNTTTFAAIVIGSGLAGLSVALRLAKQLPQQRVALITKKSLAECNSYHAQGGIAAVIDQADAFSDHIADTLNAGAGLCDEAVVKYIVEHAPAAVNWLVDIGVPFSLDNSNTTGFHLTREGGHSFRRILHSNDSTGKAIIDALIAQVRLQPNIAVLENHVVIDLITSTKLGLLADIHHEQNYCHGLYALNRLNNQIITLKASSTVLASGGTAKVYLYTTNPDIATGDGIAMAYRAGCKVANMEFMQFHPTCLFHPHAKNFLISEVVRGEGGILTLANGERFMQYHDKRLELAPRDIVARAIDYEMKKHGLDHVYLDISHKGAKFIQEHFPMIYTRCKDFALDITKEAIPVVPAAHYTCGGVMTDLNGSTDIANLYAVGECAYTGLHGANRLASNSLLECLVIGMNATEHILKHLSNVKNHKNAAIKLPSWDASQVSDNDEAVIITHNWDELRRTMWDYVGIVRTNKRLERAMHRINLLKNEIHEYYANFKLSADLIELRNLLINAELIVKSAMLRHESRGLHFNRDYPKQTMDVNITIL